MMIATHAAALASRHIRALLRQPFLIGMTLAQPLVWLLLFGSLFQSVAALPGFEEVSYLVFLAPGVAVMSAVFSGGWLGAGLVEDMERGVLDRMLATPVSRLALHLGRLAQQTIITVVQTAVILGLAWLLGARFAGGLTGSAVLFLTVLLLSSVTGALSITVALVARKTEAVVVAVQLVVLPLCFMSSVFMAPDFMPTWLQSAAAYNPVHWASEAGRGALNGTADPTAVIGYLALLSIGTCAALGCATRAFNHYRSSL